MTQTNPLPPMTPLANTILTAHKAQPKTNMYATQAIIDKNNVADMDAAYVALVAHGHVAKGSGHVSVKGEPRSTFILRD